MTEVWLAFIAGLVGSPHCLGMCGGIVAALSLTDRLGPPPSRILSQVFYNLGRITTYALLGAAAGLIGSSLDLLAVRSAAFWFYCAANVFVIAVGLASALGLTWFNFYAMESAAGHLLARPLRRAISGNTPLSAFPLGLLLGFLPCGLVYGPLMVAAGSGSPFLGGAIMAALGFGTMPVLFIFGSASTAVSSAMRERMFRSVGLIVALMGMAGLWRVLAKMGYLPKFPLL
ncbi:MAG: sulfite exporter TauE/SafE family protein [Geobacteraceae bacterium]|nr:sulfite exporter TauE/SafE family protein [Geobacteraceae bacterium]